MARALLQEAIYKSPVVSREGMLERLFAFWFQRFVYNQIWEDPVVDLEAMEITPDSRIITIASGGCNVMNYLTAGPAAVTAIDLNPCHIHLTRLKLAAARHLPGYAEFYTMFGLGQDRINLEHYRRYIRPHLPAATQEYWEQGLGKPRIHYFAKGLYNTSLLGRFIGLLHWGGRALGTDPSKIMAARTLDEQKTYFDEHIAPAFDKWIIRMVGRMPFVLYSLGIPPTQFAALRDACNGNLAELCRERLRKLACDFPLQDNYFAWQAFGRRYDHAGGRALPEYLKAEHYEALRERVSSADTHITTMTGFLRQQPAASYDRYVLLDAQDWMNAEQLTDLWMQIARTARPGARVIFRTAVAESPLEAALPASLLSQFDYQAERSRELEVKDRSAIYGGFHLYTLR